MTALDNALYEYAVQLYNGTTVPVLSLESVNATERYFQQGPRSRLYYAVLFSRVFPISSVMKMLLYCFMNVLYVLRSNWHSLTVVWFKV